MNMSHILIIVKFFIVCTCTCRYDDKEFDHAILVLGDSGGGICIMEFTRATRCLFGYFGTSKGGNNIATIYNNNNNDDDDDDV